MKRLLLLASCISANLFSTAQTPMMTIDSVRFSPVYASASDSVYLHVYGWSPNSTSLAMPPTSTDITTSYHLVEFCYTVGMTAVVTTIHDSVYLFNGPNGTHIVVWSVIQNTSSTSLCDTTVNSSTTTLAVGIPEPGATARKLTWNSFSQIMSCNSTGSFSLYNLSGQLILRREVEVAETLVLSYLKGIYFATLTTNDGVSSTLKVVCQ